MTRMKKIFVTGASGNLGQHVVGELQRRGMMVHALTRTGSVPEGCVAVKGDLERFHELASTLERVDGIVHLASSRSNKPEAAIGTDVIGTAQLVGLWRRGPFVYASTQTVHGTPTGKLTDESGLRPECWYDLAKCFGELNLSILAGRHGRGAGVSLRMAVIPTWGSRAGDRQFFEDIFQHCHAGGFFVVDSKEGAGRYGTSFLGPKDASVAVGLALRLRQSGAYHVKSGFVTWRELLRVYDRTAGTSSRLIARPRGIPAKGEMRLPCSISMVVDKNFRNVTGFAPHETITGLVQQFVDHANR